MILVKKALYTLISVEQPVDKLKSLKFKISNGYETKGVYNSNIYDPLLQKEMDVIITVLNRLFDENNKEYYIGNSNSLFHLQNKTNLCLKNINNYTKYVSRKNKGIRLIPLVNNIIHNIPASIKPKPKKQSLRVTRKASKYNYNTNTKSYDINEKKRK